MGKEKRWDITIFIIYVLSAVLTVVINFKQESLGLSSNSERLKLLMIAFVYLMIISFSLFNKHSLRIVLFVYAFSLGLVVFFWDILFDYFGIFIIFGSNLVGLLIGILILHLSKKLNLLDELSCAGQIKPKGAILLGLEQLPNQEAVLQYWSRRPEHLSHVLEWLSEHGNDKASDRLIEIFQQSGTSMKLEVLNALMRCGKGSTIKFLEQQRKNARYPSLIGRIDTVLKTLRLKQETAPEQC